MAANAATGPEAGGDAPLNLVVGVERWPLAEPFRIARGVKTEAVTVVVRLSDGRALGRGECTPYPRYDETPDGVADAIAALAPDFAAPATPAARRAALEGRLDGAARNALDCALWDLEARRTGRSVSALTGAAGPTEGVETAVTLSLDAPEAMAAAAARAVETRRAGLLKAKLGGGDAALEAARLRAVRAAAPAARVIVDANEGWSLATLRALDPVCAEIGALFIEQPTPAEADDALAAALAADGPLATPLCADESCHDADDLARLAGVYQVVNVKLDKTGGLTGALTLRAAAAAAGFDVMIGCMVAGSLAMAPAYLLTAGALAVDLDGPLLLARDRADAIRFDGAWMRPPPAALWGG